MDMYKVTVTRLDDDAYVETLFELAGSAALVQGIVPGVLDTVLAQSSREGDRTIADRVFDAAATAGRAAEQQAEGGETDEQKTKRTRRTKAQIAADKEAQGLGFRDAAHRAEVESSLAQQRVADGPASVASLPEGAVPVPPAAPAGEVVAGSVPGAIVTEPAAAPIAPPYNPFAS